MASGAVTNANAWDWMIRISQMTQLWRTAPEEEEEEEEEVKILVLPFLFLLSEITQRNWETYQ